MKKIFFVIAACFICKIIIAQNVGIGVAAPQQKLYVAGNIKLSGALMPNGTAGIAGQVLTSTGAGTAPLWSNTAYTGGGRFWLTTNNNARTTSGFTGRGGFIVDGAVNETSQEDSLDFGLSNETGTDFTINNPGLINNYITVNRTGLYHFEGLMRHFVTSSSSITMYPRATLHLLVNSTPDLTFLLYEDVMEKTGGTETGNATFNTYNYTGKFQINIHLTAGNKITWSAGFNNLRFPSSVDLNAIGISSGSFVTGHFVSE
jgi:hypothetical protein